MIIPNIWKVKKIMFQTTNQLFVLPTMMGYFLQQVPPSQQVPGETPRSQMMPSNLPDSSMTWRTMAVSRRENYPSTIQGGAPLVPSGKLTLLLKMTIEIVDLPSYNIVIFHSYVSLPEGNKLVYKHHELGRFF